MDSARADALAAHRTGRLATVPVFTVIRIDRGGARLCPCGLASTTPQFFVLALPNAGFTTPGSSFGTFTPPDAPLPTHIHQIRVGIALRDFKTSVPRVVLSVPLAGPAPSGSADTPRLWQGCSHPLRHLPDQAALSSCRAAATTRRQRSLASTQITAPHGARSQRSTCSRSPSKAGSPRPATNQCQGRIHR